MTRAKAALQDRDLDGRNDCSRTGAAAGDGEAMLLLGNLAYRAGDDAFDLEPAGEAGDPVAHRTWWVKAVVDGDSDAMAAMIAEAPPARDARDLEDALAAAVDGNVQRIYRLNGGWTKINSAPSLTRWPPRRNPRPSC